VRERIPLVLRAATLRRAVILPEQQPAVSEDEAGQVVAVPRRAKISDQRKRHPVEPDSRVEVAAGSAELATRPCPKEIIS
jgi:hypothetical protein